MSSAISFHPTRRLILASHMMRSTFCSSGFATMVLPWRVHPYGVRPFLTSGVAKVGKSIQAISSDSASTSATLRVQELPFSASSHRGEPQANRSNLFQFAFDFNEQFYCIYEPTSSLLHYAILVRFYERSSMMSLRRLCFALCSSFERCHNTLFIESKVLMTPSRAL